MPDYLTIPEVAERLRVSAKTVRRLLKRGELRGLKVGSQWRIAVADLAAFEERASGTHQMKEG